MKTFFFEKPAVKNCSFDINPPYKSIEKFAKVNKCWNNFLFDFCLTFGEKKLAALFFLGSERRMTLCRSPISSLHLKSDQFFPL
jgi:hypothetical protein